MFKEIGVLDAKARFSELLKEVGAGRRYTITVHGKPVADLVPSPSNAPAATREAISAMHSFEKIEGVGAQLLADLISAGRK